MRTPSGVMPSLVLAPSRESPPTAAPSPWLVSLRDLNGPDEAGHKAWHLARMAAAGVPIPPAIVVKCASAVGATGVEGDPPRALIESLRARTAAMLAEGPVVLRGSSSGAPVGAEPPAAVCHLDLFSDLRTFDALADAMAACWPALPGAAPASDGDPAGALLAAGLIIQRQVEPAMSGIIRRTTTSGRAGTEPDYEIDYCDGAIDAMVSGWVDPMRLRVRLDDVAVAPAFRTIARLAALVLGQAQAVPDLASDADLPRGGHSVEWAIDRADAVWIIAVRRLAEPAPARPGAATPADAAPANNSALAPPAASTLVSRRSAWTWPEIPSVRIVYRRLRLWSPAPIDAVTA